MSTQQKHETLKVLVVGQTPPPFGGQAMAIARLLKSDLADVQLIHVRMAFSSHMNELGHVRLSKIVHLLTLIARIVYRRFADRTRVLYYPPAGPDRVPVIRDIVVLLATRWLFEKTVFHFHAGGVSDIYTQLPGWQRWFFRRAYFGADAAILCSVLNPDDGRRLNAKREYLIPYGIDDPCPESCGSMRKPVELRRDVLRILFVGILRESKGVLDLIEACGKLTKQGVSVEVEMMGQWHSDAFAAQVNMRVRELGLSDRVRFLGVLTGDEKFAAFHRANVFCFPTFFNCETFGLVLLEAMACGLPVVSTRWRGIPSIVDEGSTGFLVAPRDVNALAERLTLLADDPELRERMGSAGRAKFEQEYTFPKYANRMRSALLQTVGWAVEEIPFAVAEPHATQELMELNTT